MRGRGQAKGAEIKRWQAGGWRESHLAPLRWMDSQQSLRALESPDSGMGTDWEKLVGLTQLTSALKLPPTERKLGDLKGWYFMTPINWGQTEKEIPYLCRSNTSIQTFAPTGAKG